MPLPPDAWPQVKDVFYRALEQPVEKRRAFVASACDGAPALLEAVEQMLDSHGRAATFVETPTVALLSSSGAVLSGQRVGSYVLEDRLGAGGMGEVYKARDERLNRAVALKFVTEDAGGDRAARARFLREAQTGASLSHPNICTIHEIGEVRAEGDAPSLARGTPFIAMEFLDGVTLAALLAQRPRLEVEEIVR